MRVGGEAPSGVVKQQRPLAAQRFGDEECGAAACGQRGGVELDELEVAQDRARAQRQSQPVGGRGGRIGRAGVERADAAGREQGGPRGDRAQPPARVGGQRADAAPSLDRQIDSRPALAQIDLVALNGLFDALLQRALDVQARAVAAGVQHARLRVRALAGQRQLAIGSAVELHAQRN